MSFKKIFILLLLWAFACGDEYNDSITITRPQVEQEPKTVIKTEAEQIEWLKSQISYLIGTVGTLDEFIKTDFATCSDNLATFEKKICQIAQAASAEEQVLFIDQVGELNKVFQNELFGEDCIDNVEVGCPVAGSVLSEITILDQRITTIEGNNNNASISDLQDQIDALTLIVTSIQADIAALDTRLTAAENGIISINTFGIY